ncbi:hypothetical protein AX16_004534 [Volvariella volvacea WC 439]|nr:hypothetical protein AX16_004534 [Volvariella volvacea WC 439]
MMNRFCSCDLSRWKPIQFLLLAVIWAAILAVTLTIAVPKLIVPSLDFIAPGSLPISADVTLATELISADPVTRTIVMDWYPRVSSTSLCPSNNNLVADIYLDSGIISSSSPAFSILPPHSPVYRLNLTDLCGGYSVMSSFRTESKLLASEYGLGYPRALQSNLQSYPFDVYYAPFVFFASNPESGEYISLNITRSYGVAANFHVTLHNDMVVFGVTEGPKWLHVTLQVERSTATKMMVLLVALTQWLAATSFVAITVTTFKYRTHKIYSEVFVLPTASLFAFTTIRENLPGAPDGFGAAIDLYSIVPVLIIMSICVGPSPISKKI